MTLFLHWTRYVLKIGPNCNAAPSSWAEEAHPALPVERLNRDTTPIGFQIYSHPQVPAGSPFLRPAEHPPHHSFPAAGAGVSRDAELSSSCFHLTLAQMYLATKQACTQHQSCQKGWDYKSEQASKRGCAAAQRSPTGNSLIGLHMVLFTGPQKIWDARSTQANKKNSLPFMVENPVFCFI